MSIALGAVTIASSAPISQEVPNEGAKGIVIGNESGLTCTIVMEGGGVSKTLYPGIVDWFNVNKGFTGNILIKPQTILNNVSSWPASELLFDVIGLNDPENASQYPVSLNRNNNIGNSVNTNVTATNAIDNETNGPGVNWLKVQPTDAASPTFSGDTAGNLTVKSDNAGVLTTLLQLIAGASPGVKLAAAAVLTEVLGSLQADLGVLLPNAQAIQSKDTGGTVRSILLEDGSNQVKLQAGGANNILIVDNGGTTLASFDGTGLNLPSLPVELGGVTVLSKGANTHLNAPSAAQILFDVAGVNVASIDTTGVNAINGVNYNVGRIKDINNGTVAASGTVNHGLSGTPAAVLMTPDVAGSSWTVSANTYTSTQFSCTLNSALTTRWVAYR